MRWENPIADEMSLRREWDAGPIRDVRRKIPLRQKTGWDENEMTVRSETCDGRNSLASETTGNKNELTFDAET